VCADQGNLERVEAESKRNTDRFAAESTRLAEQAAHLEKELAENRWVLICVYVCKIVHRQYEYV
jgi:hypothetical protein